MARMRYWNGTAWIALNAANADTLATRSPATIATVNTIMQRDAQGRSQVAAPSAAADIARLDTVETRVSRTGDTMSGTLNAANVGWGVGHSRGINLAEGTDLNNLVNAGWYDVSLALNRPAGSDTAWSRVMVTRGHSDLWVHQLLTSLHSDRMLHRRSIDGGGGVRAWQPWQEIWHSGRPDVTINALRTRMRMGAM